MSDSSAGARQIREYSRTKDLSDFAPRRHRIRPCVRRNSLPFVPFPDLTFLGRDNRECTEFGEIGPRMYMVDVDGVERIYVEESPFDGAINVLECQQFEHQRCPAMGYHYRGVLYLYGTHNHNNK